MHISLACLNNCRYLDGKQFLDICSFVDPRVKGTRLLDSEEKAALHDEIYRKLSAIVEKQSTSTSTALANENDNTVSDTKPSSLSSLLGDQYDEMAGSSTKDESLIWLEIKNYIREKPCPLNSSPLIW